MGVLKDTPPHLRWVPPFVFLILHVLHMGIGLSAAGLAAGPTDAVGSRTVEDSGGWTCARIHRRQDYPVVNLAIGNPPVSTELLLVFRQTTETAVSLFAPQVARSTALRCEDGGVGDGGSCSDVALLSESPSAPQKRHRLRFRYTAADLAPAWSVAKRLGLDGEFLLHSETAYALSQTHLCWRASDTILPPTVEDERARVVLREDGNLLVAVAELTMETPAATCARQPFNLSMASLFPSQAYSAAAWMGAHADAETGSEKAMNKRREALEYGLDCAAEAPGFEHTHTVLALDCLSPSASCLLNPSVTWRRLGARTLWLDLASGAASVQIFDDVRVDDSNSLVGSLAKLLLLVLTSMIVFARASRPTSSNSRLFNAIVDEGEQEEGGSVVVDSALGALAIASRVGVLLWRWRPMEYDEQWALLASSALACIASAIHFVNRHAVYLVTTTSDTRRFTPIILLGGSFALVDSTNAVLLAFSTPPLFGPSNFEHVARLLVSVAAVNLAVTRTIWGATCATVQSTRSYFGTFYGNATLMATLCWLTQLISSSIALFHLFACPSAYSMLRATAGDYKLMAGFLFITITVTGAPASTRCARDVLC